MANKNKYPDGTLGHKILNGDIIQRECGLRTLSKESDRQEMLKELAEIAKKSKNPVEVRSIESTLKRFGYKDIDKSKKTTTESVSKPKSAKPAPATDKPKTSKLAGKRTCKPKTVKVGDKIVGTVNGMVGVIKDVRQDTVNTSRGNRQTSPYAVIEVLNPKKGQQRIITTSLDNINRLENKGGIRLEKQKPKTSKPAPSAPAKNKPTSPKTATKPSEAKSYTVRQGRTCKTFATKTEARAYKEQCKNKNVTITEGTKKPTHRVVKFTARK